MTGPSEERIINRTVLLAQSSGFEKMTFPSHIWYSYDGNQKNGKNNLSVKVVCLEDVFFSGLKETKNAHLKSLI